LDRRTIVKVSWLGALWWGGALCGCASGARPAQDPMAAGTHPDGSPGATADAKNAPKARPKPPSPSSVSMKEPGGDAADPQEAALFRQLDEAWGQRNDRDDQLLVPLPDSNHWKRVRYWGVEHFVGFRYGNEHHALVIGFSQQVPPGTPITTDTCMRRFEAWGRPQTKPFDVKFGPFAVHQQRWRDKRLEVHAVDGEVSVGFTTTSFSAAWAAYPAYSDGCLIYAVAVPWRDHPELARQVRDRFIKEGFTQIEPKTTEHAVRKER
jgi:hypothetical protein